MSYFRDSHRIVVKLGTSTLTHNTGHLNLRRIEKLVKVLSDMQNSGIQVILVSSGAVSAGVAKVGFGQKPTEMADKQAMAAIGQSELMKLYDRLFSDYGHTVAQILMTKDILSNPARREAAENTFNRLLEMRCIPIVNENDVISTYELEFGDNDTLSAYIAKLVEAELLVILSDIDGLYDSNPQVNSDAKLIPVVEKVDESVYAIAGGAGSRRGTGGMVTKLKAAEIVNPAGIDMIITNGAYPERVYDIFDGKQTGTLFVGEK